MCLTLSVITERQIKITRYHHVHSDSYNQKGKNKCWQECGKTGTLINYWWECKTAQLHWETLWLKLNIELLYEPAVPLLGIYQRTCTQMFTEALLLIAKIVEQFKCPADEWINKYGISIPWNITQSQKVLLHDITWMNLENTMLNKTDTKGQTSYDSTHTRYQEKENSQSQRV